MFWIFHDRPITCLQANSQSKHKNNAVSLQGKAAHEPRRLDCPVGLTLIGGYTHDLTPKAIFGPPMHGYSGLLGLGGFIKSGSSARTSHRKLKREQHKSNRIVREDRSSELVPEIWTYLD